MRCSSLITSLPTASKTVNLRPIRPDDQEFLCRLYGSTRTEELAAVDWPEHQKEAFLRMQFTAQHAYYQEHYPEASFQLLELEGRPAGRLYVQRWPEEIRLIDISLLPEHRNAGLGSSLLRELLAEARDSGRSLTIHVEKFNPALRLYERLGFVQKADRGVYWFLEWRAPVNVPQQTQEYPQP
jgi:ribosomal protein S18 acetylase RimI-like enzyme